MSARDGHASASHADNMSDFAGYSPDAVVGEASGPAVSEAPAAVPASSEDSWGSAVAEALAAHDQGLPLPNISRVPVGPACKTSSRGRGRGSRLWLHQQQEQAAAAKAKAKAVPQALVAAGGRQDRGRGSEYAKAKMKAVRECRQQPEAILVQQAAAASPPLYGDFELMTKVGTGTQRSLAAVLNKSLKDKEAEQSCSGNFDILHTIMDGDVLTCSASSMAKLFQEKGGRARVQQVLVEAGAASHQMSGVVCSSLLSMLHNMFMAAGARPLMFFLKMKYDESPTKVRVATVVQGLGQDALMPMRLVLPQACRSPEQVTSFLQAIGASMLSHSETAKHAKILQTQMAIGVLYVQNRGEENEHFTWVRGSVPCSLQAMDAATAENERRCLLETIMMVPEIERLAQSFEIKLRHVCCD